MAHGQQAPLRCRRYGDIDSLCAPSIRETVRWLDGDELPFDDEGETVEMLSS
jgi:hypothetical protein